MTGTIEALEKRLNMLEANLAIRDLKSRYWCAVDMQDIDTIRECLLGDADIDMEGVGVMTGAEFVEFVERNGCKPGMYNLHAGLNPVIRVGDDGAASGEWNSWFSGIDTGSRTMIQMSGVYKDRYRLVDGGWKIAAMNFRQTSFLMHAYDDNASPTALSLGRGNDNAFGS